MLARRNNFLDRPLSEKYPLLMGANAEWKQNGNVFFWQHAGYHFTGDKEGCASLIALVDLLKSNDLFKTAAVRLSLPSDRVMAPPNFGKSELPNRWHSSEMKLRVDRANGQEKKFLIKENDRKSIHIEVGLDALEEFRRALLTIPKGAYEGGDFQIGCGQKDNTPLWIWWYLGN